MLGLFKKIGKILLYIIEVPIFIVALALFAVVGLIGIIILFIKSIVLFFTGRSLYDDLPEDKKAKEIIQKSSPTYVASSQAPVNNTQVAPNPTPIYQQPRPVNNGQNTQVSQTQGNIESFVFEDENNVPKQEIRIEENEQEYPRFEENSPKIHQDNGVSSSEIDDSFEMEQEPDNESNISIEDMNEPTEQEEEIERYVPKSDMFRDINDIKSDDDSGIEIAFDREDR